MDELRAALVQRAEGIEIPLVDVESLVMKGRQARRRRVSLLATGVAAVLALLAATGLMAIGGSKERGNRGPAAPQHVQGHPYTSLQLYRQIGPVASDGVLHVGTASVNVGTTLVGIYPTAYGAVYRIHNNGSSISQLRYLGVDGSRSDIASIDRGAGVAADAAGVHVAWTVGLQPGRYALVVAVVPTGQQVARTTVAGGAPPGRPAPLLALSGSTLYAAFDSGWMSWDYPTDRSPVDAAAYAQRSQVRAGVLARRVDQRTIDVVDLATGNHVGRYRVPWGSADILSPDGQSLLELAPTGLIAVLSIPGGAVTRLPAGNRVETAFWLSVGAVVVVTASRHERSFETCVLATVTCDAIDFSVPARHLVVP